ncbi:MAG TPA: hypothetical protein DCS07_03230 [Bdellovibrionales bacterium]|nr:MAG: hypothetical protein A2Z97_06970 [Bdellovibrionales bacterium GWB1_52_6]OFZ05452.1 MAG: hypothetical protein A2X97_11280 [Bdellovibrionales bacterium GWA1_52_35]OFZ36285.1 MAG: hypothetical protein A2070_12470 [Bdellovibrionales bacterium GWC1_52_8]HAR41634.1 hypothetical protein [Bdellovibrionales bacterium]HCM39185.1 hypothetical protein [Bdellovibrionales bacterium]
MKEPFSDPAVRRMKTSDLPSCAEIVGRTPLFGAYGFTTEGARKLLSKALRDTSSKLFVALAPDRQTPTGFAWFITRGAFQRSAYLRLIAVDPAGTQKGVGSALLKKFEKRYLEPYGIFLLVTRSNIGARRFYRKLGYRRVGEVPDYVKNGITECIYFKAPFKTTAPSTKKRLALAARSR